MIPRHSVGMQYADYWPYFASRLVPSLYHNLDINQVTAELMPGCRTIGTPTGRHALWYFLELKNFAPGTEVLISAYNYYVVVRLVIQAGLTPVFVDIEADTLCMDPRDLADKVTDKSGLILVTHMFGNPADMGAISRIAKEHSLSVFEDCAHAVGSYIGNTHLGMFGEGALFSFGVAKIVNCFGGGMLALSNNLGSNYHVPDHRASFSHCAFDTFCRFVLTTIYNPVIYRWTMLPLVKLANRLSRRGNHWLTKLIAPSKNDATWYFDPSQRARFKPFMLSMLRKQLNRIEDNVQKRRKNVSNIKQALMGHDQFQWLNEDKHGLANGSYFGLYTDDKQGLSEYLFKHNIDNNPQEFFDCSALAQFDEYRCECPRAKYASQHLIRLPSHPTLKPKQIQKIIDLLKGFSNCHEPQ